MESGDSCLICRGKPALAGFVTAGSVEEAFKALPIALAGVVFEGETRELRVPAVESVSWS